MTSPTTSSEDNPPAAAVRVPMCDHICLRDDGHVDRGEPHFYGYELPSPRASALADVPTDDLLDELRRRGAQDVSPREVYMGVRCWKYETTWRKERRAVLAIPPQDIGSPVPTSDDHERTCLHYRSFGDRPCDCGRNIGRSLA